MSYGRSARLVIGDRVIEAQNSSGLRLSFDITRDKSRDPNSATIEVWNLAEKTRAQFEEAERIACELEAGYRDESTHRIFTGVLLDAVSSRQGPDWITTFTLGDDGEQRAAINRIRRTFPTGTPLAAVFRELVKATGLKPGNLSEILTRARLGGSGVMPRSWTASGSALQALHTFTRSAGFQYTIQNGEVVFIGFAPGNAGRGPVLTGENIERPSLDADGSVKFTCRLVPDLLPGTPFRLDTEKVKGDFAAIATHHFGDTHGQDWSVDVQGDPISRIMTEGLRVNA